MRPAHALPPWNAGLVQDPPDGWGSDCVLYSCLISLSLATLVAAVAAVAGQRIGVAAGVVAGAGMFVIILGLIYIIWQGHPPPELLTCW